MADPYEIRREAERLIGDDRVPTDVLREIVEQYGLTCPECGEPVWDGPYGSKLAKCWNSEGHASGGTLAFDTMG